MKHVVIPIARILMILLFVLIYYPLACVLQILHFIWHLKFGDGIWVKFGDDEYWERQEYWQCKSEYYAYKTFKDWILNRKVIVENKEYKEYIYNLYKKDKKHDIKGEL